MSSTPGDSYFVNQVLGAPRHKLHLMLLEGALRHGRRAEALQATGDGAAAVEAIARAQEIMTELLAGLKPEAAPPLVSKVAGVYVFIHRALGQAVTRHDSGKLREALDVLELECETWRQVCHQADGPPATPPAATPPATSAAAQPTDEPRVPRPAFLNSPWSADLPSASFEA